MVPTVGGSEVSVTEKLSWVKKLSWSALYWTNSART